MAELLPEFWGPLSTKDSSPPEASRVATPRRRRAVTDIATWIQCFTTYISVTSTLHPQVVPELLAYLTFILRASQDFGGVAWVTYNQAFRRQAYITSNRSWSNVNPSLYSICFAGVARVGQRCDLCLSLSHPTRECTLGGDPEVDVSSRLRTLESALLAVEGTTQPSPSPQPGFRTRSAEVCRKYDMGRCCMLNCRYRHVCRVCGGSSPVWSCCERQLGPRPGESQATICRYGFSGLQSEAQSSNWGNPASGTNLQQADRGNRGRPY